LKFELKQCFSDEAVVMCPECRNGAQRLFSPVPIIFKGSGFYVTDNARRGETQSSVKETKAEHKGEPENTVKQDKKEDKGSHKEAEK
jgi:predicted nucleic acid-binding Zn ribbon protein